MWHRASNGNIGLIREVTRDSLCGHSELQQFYFFSPFYFIVQNIDKIETAKKIKN
jgi:hypothetical protein